MKAETSLARLLPGLKHFATLQNDIIAICFQLKGLIEMIKLDNDLNEVIVKFNESSDVFDDEKADEEC